MKLIINFSLFNNKDKLSRWLFKLGVLKIFNALKVVELIIIDNNSSERASLVSFRRICCVWAHDGFLHLPGLQLAITSWRATILSTNGQSSILSLYWKIPWDWFTSQFFSLSHGCRAHSFRDVLVHHSLPRSAYKWKTLTFFAKYASFLSRDFVCFLIRFI